MPLADRQRGFSAALVDRGAPLPPGLVGPDGEPSSRRFGVYRNNVVAGLTEALTEAFPAVRRIVGEDFFRAMARLYALSHPPPSPILLHYGEDLPDFIAGFEPAESLPYLADVARIERAWSESYHSREASPLDAHAFAAFPQNDLAELRLMLHPSLRVVRSHFPARTIWRMNVEGGEPGLVDFSIAEDTLIVRPRAEVEVRSIPPGGAEFLSALAAGNAFGEAVRKAVEACPGFDLEANLVGLIGAEVFTALVPS